METIKIKQLIEAVHNTVFSEPFDYTKSLKNQGYDSLDIVEFLYRLEQSASIDQIDNITAARLVENPYELVEFLEKEVKYINIKL